MTFFKLALKQDIYRHIGEPIIGIIQANRVEDDGDSLIFDGIHHFLKQFVYIQSQYEKKTKK